VSVRGLSNRQVVDALARAAEVDRDAVGEAGGRDRQAVVERWLSVPKAAVEHPKRLRNAGSQGKLRVLEVREGARAVDAVAVVGLAWQLRLRGAASDGGYLRARAILDRLRHAGFPNYLAAPLTHPGHARLGRLLAQKRALPPRAAQGVSRRRLMAAYQARLTNLMIGERCAAGDLGCALPGDVLEVGCNRPPHRRALEVVADPAAAQPRIESWEAVPMAPLFGDGMAVAEDLAAEREWELLAREGVEPVAFARLVGGRRAYRVRPAAAQVDLDGEDLVLDCQLPTGAFLDHLIAEFTAGAPDGGGEDDD